MGSRDALLWAIWVLSACASLCRITCSPARRWDQQGSILDSGTETRFSI